MILHAELFTPLWLATGAKIVMTLFGMNDAGVALREFLKTRITVALIEALAGVAATVHTADLTAEVQLHMAAQQ